MIKRIKDADDWEAFKLVKATPEELSINRQKFINLLFHGRLKRPKSNDTIDFRYPRTCCMKGATGFLNRKPRFKNGDERNSFEETVGDYGYKLIGVTQITWNEMERRFEGWDRETWLGVTVQEKQWTFKEVGQWLIDKKKFPEPSKKS